MAPVVVGGRSHRGAAEPGRRADAVRQTARLHEVAQRLAGEFAQLLPPDIVPTVVNQAYRDLVDEVPGEALPEFVFHAARQRLVEAVGADSVGPADRRLPMRRRAS
ncbi:hypothetical protein Namu_2637 [Nakamurella multipartita DSM 44233]|uniref:Uncharacterized protein n=2 Tax=Nakamurella TaxID=53460 RepID=C8X7N3_NAKMY|nr:hypothetical protein Namu_2637 [Nakamurella multipartita DSM 44233]